jgi:predicted component of type VI protein secretion system
MIKPINIYDNKEQSTPIYKQGARARLEFMAKVSPPNTIQALQHLFREMDLQAIDEETGEILDPTDLEIIFNQSNKNT